MTPRGAVEGWTSAPLERLRDALWTDQMGDLERELGDVTFQRFAVAVHAGEGFEAQRILRAAHGTAARELVCGTHPRVSAAPCDTTSCFETNAPLPESTSLASALQDALAWVRQSLAGGDGDDTLRFFALDHAAQVMAIECMRAAARGAIEASGIPGDRLIDAVDRAFHGWIT